jgi:hypothetical protein
MASLMDVSLTKHFTSIYVFLLVFAGVYALLEKTKILGEDKKNINAIIAVVFALLIIIPVQDVLSSFKQKFYKRPAIKSVYKI